MLNFTTTGFKKKRTFTILLSDVIRNLSQLIQLCTHVQHTYVYLKRFYYLWICMYTYIMNYFTTNILTIIDHEENKTKEYTSKE